MTDPIQAFYAKYPLPDPVEQIPDTILAGTGRLEGCPSWFSHVYWPWRAPRGDLDILIAGCGTSQAAIYGASLPAARLVAIDVSERSLAHSTALCAKYRLANVEHRCIDLAEVGQLGRRFDLVISTGVLHHTADPDAALGALRDVVREDGALSLMLYATYGRPGVYYMQEMLRRIGVTAETCSDEALDAIRGIVRSLPAEHPLTPKLGQLHADIASRSSLADLFLNPRDRAYTVPEIYALLARSGLVLQAWFNRSQYEPACQGLAASRFMRQIARLAVAERYAIGELYSTRIIRHRFVACRDDRPPASWRASLEDDGWRTLIPMTSRAIVVDPTDAPVGRSPWLTLPHHRQDGIRVNLGPGEIERFNLIDGSRTIDAIERAVPALAAPGEDDPSRAFWRKLHAFDLIDCRGVR